MNSFTLKLIGILSMLCDHVGKAFFPSQPWLQFIGRFAFPIFAFEIAQGYLHTKNFNKYAIRLTIFAIISQIPYSFFITTHGGDYTKLNVIFTLLLGLMAIYLYDTIQNKWLSIGLILSICIIAELLKLDYGAYGIGTILLFYWYSKLTSKKNNPPQRKIPPAIITIFIFTTMTTLKYLGPIMANVNNAGFWICAIIFTILSSIPVLLYNGKLGPKCKYLFYIFYPAHLLVLYMIWAIM